MRIGEYLITDFQEHDDVLKIIFWHFVCQMANLSQTNQRNCREIVKATVCLHNCLRLTENATLLPSGFVDS